MSLFVVASLVFVSCKEDTANDTYSKARDISVSFNSQNNYSFKVDINIPSSDVVLVYRRDLSSGGVVWQQIPRTLYLTQGELDYDFDFTTQDAVLYAGGTINLPVAAQDPGFNNGYLINQTFRVVLVPASFGKNANIDYSDYNSVAKYYNIDESKVIKQ